MRRNRLAVALGAALLFGLGVSGARADDAAGASSPAAPDSAGDAMTQIGEVRSRAEATNEQVQTLQSDVDKLKKFKLSGYVQARWETGETKSDSVKVSGNPAVIAPANNERFTIRRARVKLTYDASPLSQAVVYFDAGADRAVRLLEAHVTLFDPWTVLHRHALTIGQMAVPFGYEIERSSSVRELPERSRAENVLFSGERDRGVKIVSRWGSWLETVVGAFNGGGVNHPEFPNTDPTRGKDVVVRARASYNGRVDGAMSYYSGKNTTPLTGPDVETDKTRLGIDGQAYYELPRLGGGSLRAEFYDGTEINADSVKALVAAPTADRPTRVLKDGANAGHLATDFSGWYVMWVQNAGEKFQVAARYDAYDPNADADHDQFARTGLGVSYFYDGFTRITVAYDIPRTDVKSGADYKDPHDNLWTVQVQHKF